MRTSKLKQQKAAQMSGFFMLCNLAEIIQPRQLQI